MYHYCIYLKNYCNRQIRTRLGTERRTFHGHDEEGTLNRITFSKIRESPNNIRYSLQRKSIGFDSNGNLYFQEFVA